MMLGYLYKKPRQPADAKEMHYFLERKVSIEIMFLKGLLFVAVQQPAEAVPPPFSIFLTVKFAGLGGILVSSAECNASKLLILITFQRANGLKLASKNNILCG